MNRVKKDFILSLFQIHCCQESRRVCSIVLQLGGGMSLGGPISPFPVERHLVAVLCYGGCHLGSYGVSPVDNITSDISNLTSCRELMLLMSDVT